MIYLTKSVTVVKKKFFVFKQYRRLFVFKLTKNNTIKIVNFDFYQLNTGALFSLFELLYDQAATKRAPSAQHIVVIIKMTSHILKNNLLFAARLILNLKK